MTRERLLYGLLAVLALAAAGWLYSALEYVEKEVRKPPQGDAARNQFYAAEKLLRALGASVARPTDLRQFPPAGARLVLDSYDWDLFPDRAARLQRWVEGGGHLVVGPGFLQNARARAWLPVRLRGLRDEAAARASRRVDREGCQGVSMGTGPAPRETARLCTYALPGKAETGGKAITWSLLADDDYLAFRVGVGRGDVTVLAPWSLQYNEELLKADNALIFSRALQLERGATVWIVAEEKRAPLLLWIWQNAWFAVLLAFAALAAALWRGAVRFGPRSAATALPRRSIAEQVRGTAQFLRRHGPASLHAAARRALDEAARARLPGTAALETPRRLAAVARAGDVDPAALELALEPPRKRSPGVSAKLALMEMARRRLRARKHKRIDNRSS